MIHEELNAHLQRVKRHPPNEHYRKWLRSKAAKQANMHTTVRTIELVKNCSEIIYLLIESKERTILMVQDFLGFIAKELSLQEVKLQNFYNDDLEHYDPISISQIEDAFRMILPILKEKLGNSKLNDYFPITIKSIKNQIKRLNVTWLTSIDDIKEECNRKKKLPLKDIAIIFKGKKLEDTILKYTEVEPGDTLFFVWMKKPAPVYVPPPPRPAITYYPTRAESPPPRMGMSASAPAPDVMYKNRQGSRFHVTHYTGSDDDDDDDDELAELKAYFS